MLVAEPPEADDADAKSPSDPGEPAFSQTPQVALVRGNADRLGIVRTLVEDDGEADDGEAQESRSLAAELARRVAGGPTDRLEGEDDDWSALLAPGDVTFVSAGAGESLSALATATPGMVVTTLGETVLEDGLS